MGWKVVDRKHSSPLLLPRLPIPSIAQVVTTAEIGIVCGEAVAVAVVVATAHAASSGTLYSNPPRYVGKLVSRTSSVGYMYAGIVG